MFKKFFSHHDIYLTSLLIALLLIGLITLFSTTRGTGLENESLFIKQLTFVAVGIVFYLILSFAKLSWLKYKWVQIGMYLFLLFLLVAVLLFTAKVKGASRWFVLPLPVIGSINIQPADIAKIIVVITGSYILTQWKNLTRNIFSEKSILKNSLIPYLLLMIPVLGLILIQPALGTTIIVFSCLLFMYYYAAPNKMKVLSYLFVLVSVILVWLIFKNFDIPVKILVSFGIVFFSSLFIFKNANKIFLLIFFILCNLLIYNITKPNSINSLGEYQKDRVDCWLSPESDPTGKCFQQIQAKIAIGSGELFGRGFSQGLQVQRERLPEFQNDFIYAAFAEQYGFIGTLVLLVVFFMFIMEIIRLSNKQQSEFSRVVILGIGVMFLLQVFINITMNTGLLPTTGISLPFLSYGGSFMWVALIAVGLVQNLSHHTILPDVENKKYTRWDDEYN